MSSADGVRGKLLLFYFYCVAIDRQAPFNELITFKKGEKLPFSLFVSISKCNKCRSNSEKSAKISP